MLEKATLGQDREDPVLIPGKAVPGQVPKMAALDQVVRNPMRTTTKAKATLAHPPAKPPSIRLMICRRRGPETPACRVKMRL